MATSNNKQNLQYVSALRDASLEDRLVIFAGSGVSVESGLPLWADLVSGIKQHLSFDASGVTDALKVAQLLYNEKGEKEYYDIIEQLIFKNSSNTPNLLHELVFALNPQHVITTNYDSFFQDVIERNGLDFSVVVKDEDLPYAKFKNLLIKYHGDFSNHNIVLKEADYLNFTSKNPLKEVFVKSLFSNKVVLFIGYSFSDINLKILNQEIRHILQKHHQSTYLISTSSQLSNSELLYYKENGINVLQYEGLCNEIPSFSDKNDKILANYSPHTKKLYKTLKLISEYNGDDYIDWGEEINKNLLIDKIYDFFLDFFYFRNVPSSILLSNKILTFQENKDISSTFFYKGYYTCQNKILYDLLKDFDNKKNNTLSAGQKEKITYIIERLTYSEIYYIQRPEDKKDSLGYSRADDKSIINIFEKLDRSEKCDCIICSISGFKYDIALKKIEDYQITQKSVLFDDLKYAYGCFLIDDFYKSFLAFEQILIKSNQLKKFEVSFICKYNLYRLSKYSALAFPNYLEYNQINELQERYINIDLDREFYKTKSFVNIHLYEFLREVKNGVLIQRFCDKIDENLIKISDTKDLLENGGASNNSDVENLYKTCFALENFLHTNFVVGNGFSRVDSAMQKAIKAFLNAYAMKQIEINEEHLLFFGNPGLSEFNNYILKIIIDYADPTQLKKQIENLKLHNIKISPVEKNKFILHVINFFNSAYDEKHAFFHHYEENYYLKNKINSDHNFHSYFLRRLKNIYLVIAYFDFSSDELKKLMVEHNKFLKNSTYHFVNADTFLNKVIFQKYKELDTTIIKELASILADKKDFGSNYILLHDIILKRDPSHRTGDIDFKNYDIEHNIAELVNLYPVLIDDKKNEVQQLIEKLFEDNKINILEYFFILNSDFPINKKLQSKYINEMIKLAKTLPSEVSSTYNTWQLIRFAILVHDKKIDLQEIKKIKTKNKFLKFIINPVDFPEKDFNYEWLNKTNFEPFISVYKNVDYIRKKLQEAIKVNNDVKIYKMLLKVTDAKVSEI